MKITFVRHGQSEANLAGIIQGCTVDTPLSPKGVEDTRAAAPGFTERYDVCFCSHLMRARQTAGILFPYLEPIIDDRLIERGLGVWENTLYTPERRLLEYEMTPEGGERFEEVEARARDFMDMLKRDYGDKKVVCVSHAGTIFSVLEICGIKGVELHNVEAVEVEY